MRYATLLVILWLGLIGVNAQSVKDLQNQQKALQSQIEQTNKMLQQTQRNRTTTVNKLELLNQNIKNQRKMISSINKELGALDAEMQQLSTRKKELINEEARLKSDYARMVRETHYAQLQQSPLLFIVSSSSFRQLVRRIIYLMDFAHLRREQVAKIRGVQVEIEQQNALLSENRDSKQKALKQQQRQQDNLARDEKKQQKMLSELKKKEKQLKADLAKQQKRVKELNKKIDEQVKKQARTTSTLTKEQQLLAGDFERNKGRLPWPVEKGFISGQFGKHQHPVYEHVTIDNKGIYLQTTQGSKARAVFAGTVTSCFVMDNTYAVIIQHGNYRSVYSGLSQLQVKQGDQVTAKQNIGTIYTNPDQDNKTELYFQIYQDTNIQNPSLWLAN